MNPKPNESQTTVESTTSAGPEPKLPESIAHYRIECLLGSGAAGHVYRAYDSRLDRYVALKWMRSGDPEHHPRFLREARLQAKMDHPNICRLYEIGEHEGTPFLAMQLIEGATLTHAMDRMTQREKVETIITVADAVHAAHQDGLVHRDIKPSNIMMTRTESGAWKPYVLDFGIARDVAGPRMTMTGVPVGTPDYMPPEQARGDSELMDSRSDVYSLGATLYMILSSHTPFEGETAFDVLTKVVHEDPAPLSRWASDVPQDLETIVMKCLEKDPAQRYPSARELAEDLRRFLHGEDIQAKPAALGHKIRRKMKRHRLASIILAAAVAVTTGLLGLLLWTQHRSRSEAFYAQLFGFQAQSIESNLRDVYSAPLHDVRPEIAAVRRRLKEMEQQMNDARPFGDGSGSLALGRGYLALGEYELASKHLQRAWDAGVQQPATAYALGKALGALYQKQLVDLDQIESRDIRQKRKTELAQQYRDPAVKLLAAARDSSESPAYMDGLIALYQRRYEPALENARTAARQTRWSYDAKKLQGDVQFEMAREALEKGEYEKTLQMMNQASTAYQEASDLGRSREEIYLNHCHAWTTAMTAQVLKGDSPAASLEKVVSICDQALKADPDAGSALLQKAAAHQSFGSYQLYNTGEDPRPALQQSIELATAARGKGPGFTADADDTMGFSFARIGEYELTHGLDPMPSLQKAIECSSRSLQVKPLNIVALNHLGVAYSMRAEYEMKRGGDALGSFRKAAEQYEKAAAIQPEDSYAPFNAGIANWFMGSYKMAHGQEPTAEFDKAIELFERTLVLAPNDGSTLNNLAIVYTGRGDFADLLGRDPLPDYRKSLELRRQALEQTHNNAYLHVGVCSVLEKISEHLLNHGADPSADLAEGKESCDAAMAISPTYYEPYDELGKLEVTKAGWLMRTGKDPEESFRSAEKHFNKAIQLNSQESTIYMHRAALSLSRAESMPAGKAAASLQAAMADMEKALALESDNAEFYSLQGEICTKISRLAGDASERKGWLDRARDSFARAIQINKFLAQRLQPSSAPS